MALASLIQWNVSVLCNRLSELPRGSSRFSVGIFALQEANLVLSEERISNYTPCYSNTFHASSNSRASNAPLSRIRASCPGTIVIAGDFNSIHVLWGGLRDFSRGRGLMNALFSEDLLVLNDGSPTVISATSIQCPRSCNALPTCFLCLVCGT